MLRVSVRVGPASDPVSYIAMVAWGWLGFEMRSYLSPTSTIFIAPAKLFCFNLTAAYLEPRAKRWWDSSLRLLRRTSRMCRGFCRRDMQRVPKCIDRGCMTTFTPGATPTDQLKDGASRLPVGSSGLLISHVGVAKIIGAPFRTLCPGEGSREARRGLRRDRVSRRWRLLSC